MGFEPPTSGASFEPITHPQDFNEGRLVGEPAPVGPVGPVYETLPAILDEPVSNSGAEPTPIGPVYQTLPAILDDAEVPSWAHELITDDTTHGATR